MRTPLTSTEIRCVALIAAVALRISRPPSPATTVLRDARIFVAYLRGEEES